MAGNENVPRRDETEVVRQSTDPVIVEHDFEDPTAEVTVSIVDGVASAVGVSPTEVVPQVNDEVDPDALDRLLRPKPDGTPRSGVVSFELLGCAVVVDGGGTIKIYE